MSPFEIQHHHFFSLFLRNILFATIIAIKSILERNQLILEFLISLNDSFMKMKLVIPTIYGEKNFPIFFSLTTLLNNIKQNDNGLTLSNLIFSTSTRCIRRGFLMNGSGGNGFVHTIRKSVRKKN